MKRSIIFICALTLSGIALAQNAELDILFEEFYFCLLYTSDAADE